MDEHKIVMAAIVGIATLGCLSSISPTINTVITGVVIVVLVLGSLFAVGYLVQINCQHPTDRNRSIPAHQAWFDPYEGEQSPEPQPEPVERR